MEAAVVGGEVVPGGGVVAAELARELVPEEVAAVLEELVLLEGRLRIPPSRRPAALPKDATFDEACGG